MEPTKFGYIAARRSQGADNVNISVVIPVHNEEDNILPLIREIQSALENIFVYEIVFVNDGSDDGTREKLEEALNIYNNCRYIELENRAGQTEALSAGFAHACGEFIVTLDGDLQNSPADIPKLYDAVSEDFPVVCGYRQNRRDSLKRRIVSYIANTVRNRVTGERLKDSGCSIRIFPRSSLEGIELFHGFHRFLPTILKIHGFPFKEIPVDHRPRRFGRSKYGVWGRLKETVYDLYVVRWMKKRIIHYSIRQETKE